MISLVFLTTHGKRIWLNKGMAQTCPQAWQGWNRLVISKLRNLSDADNSDKNPVRVEHLLGV